mgnify:CR=1 FL=1
MKKTYIAPACRVARVETETILESSITEPTNNVLDRDITGEAKRGIWQNDNEY